MYTMICLIILIGWMVCIQTIDHAHTETISKENTVPWHLLK